MYALAPQARVKHAGSNLGFTGDPPTKYVGAYVVGDSLTEGYGSPDPATDGYAAWLMGEFGWGDLGIDGQGGTGFLNTGKKAAATNSAFDGKRLAKVIAAKPRVVIIALGRNDGGLAESAERKRATTVLRKLRKGLPRAAIYVLSAWQWGTSQDSQYGPAVNQIDDALSTASKAAKVDYVNLRTSQLITDKNSKQLLYSKDHFHPNARGYEYLARVVGRRLLALHVPYVPADDCGKNSANSCLLAWLRSTSYAS